MSISTPFSFYIQLSGFIIPSSVLSDILSFFSAVLPLILHAIIYYFTKDMFYDYPKLLSAFFV